MEQIKELAMAMARAYANQERALGYFYFEHAKAAFETKQQEFFNVLEEALKASSVTTE
jgi:hypothetical protein